jgi:hypothetical protein
MYIVAKIRVFKRVYRRKTFSTIIMEILQLIERLFEANDEDESANYTSCIIDFRRFWPQA